MTRAAVFGAGSWGTSFAQVLADAGAERVTIWARREEVARSIREDHRNPDYLKAHIRLGGLLVDTDHPEEALNEFRTAVRIDPYSAVAQLSLARLLDQLDRSKEAADAYTRYLAIAPQSEHDSDEYKNATDRLRALK